MAHTNTPKADTPKRMTLAQALERIADLERRVTDLETHKPVDRNRGPKSTRAMTLEDARRIMTGDLKDAKIGTCASELGLSYGQVYSARNGYTFKEAYAERIAAQKPAKK